MENKGNQDVRITCIDMATRVVGKPVYMEDGAKKHEDVIKVASEIYRFVTKD